jgi:heavy metal sensor kinase
MANSILSQFQRWYKQRLTLRFRLALWTGIAIFTISAALTLFINFAASTTTPRYEGVSGPQPATPESQAPGDSVLSRSSVPPPAVQPAATEQARNGISPVTVALIQENVLNRVRQISLVGLGLVAVMGGLAAYWITGLALRPVHTVSTAAQQISARSLDKRLAISGPNDELKKLADAFDTMLDRLQRAFEQQSNFTADAAHELRTPLSTLRTNLEVIQSDPEATINDYREMAEAFERSLTRLEKLVEDMLLLAQGETGINFEEVALGGLVEELLGELTPLSREKNVSLQFGGESEVMIRGDTALLRRAVGNLIENGIYYNRPDGNVRIDLEQREKWIYLRIADTGVGIPPENLDLIFDRFYRVDSSRSRRKGGAGLGLSIAAHIIQLHGGQIQVESNPGFGSTFTVNLPL